MAASALLLPPTTPPDYHRIVSPTLNIPSDHKYTIPVGLLSCQRDPLLRDLSTTVISAQIYKPPTAPSGGKKAHQKQAKATAEPILASPCLQVVLHDTILFPEGGGQPSDVGVIVTGDGRVWEVALIKRHGLTAVHYIKLQLDTSVE